MSFKFVMGMRLEYSCRNFDRLIFVLPSRINFEVLPPRHHIVNIDRFSTTAPKRNIEELKKRKEEFEVETIFLDESMVPKKRSIPFRIHLFKKKCSSSKFSVESVNLIFLQMMIQLLKVQISSGER